MTPELLQLLRMVRDGEDLTAPITPQGTRFQAAHHIDHALARHLISTTPVFVLTERGREALERAEALLTTKAPMLGGAALAGADTGQHSHLQSMADHLAGACQSHVHAMPHGRINFAVVVHAGDPSQIVRAPAWAYAMAGNVSRRDQIALLEQQLRVLREQEQLEQAAAGDDELPFGEAKR